MTGIGKFYVNSVKVLVNFFETTMRAAGTFHERTQYESSNNKHVKFHDGRVVKNAQHVACLTELARKIMFFFLKKVYWHRFNI